MMTNYKNMSKLEPTPERLEFATHLIMKRGNKCDYCIGNDMMNCTELFTCEEGIKEWLLSEVDSNGENT
jgi:hypothetical protein